MNRFEQFPDANIAGSGPVSQQFLRLGETRFHGACRWVHELPYGYNSDRDDFMTLFRENKGSCTTKHAVIAALAAELGLPVAKQIGIYAMTEDLVTGTGPILAKYELPYVPMVHCFLAHWDLRVDLTAGNHNGKNRPVEDFLFTCPVAPDISEKDEYLLYRGALKDLLSTREELRGVAIKTVLHAREEGIARLRSNIA